MVYVPQNPVFAIRLKKFDIRNFMPKHQTEKCVTKFVDRRADKARRYAKPVRASAYARIEYTAEKPYDKTENADNAYHRKDLYTPVFKNFTHNTLLLFSTHTLIRLVAKTPRA
jgi:hypothetical protein